MASKFGREIFTNAISISSKRIAGFCAPPLGRSLFTAEAIGVDAYEKQRVRTQTQFSGMTDKFRDKMSEFTFSDTKNMIFTEDLKHMVHLIENRPDELTLIHEMMKRFNSQNRHLRFGNFVFGPVVMRMYHYLNQPTLALDVFNDPALDGFFEQFSSYQILLDLLYNHEMYQEILNVFEIIKTKQIQGQKYPRNVTILVFGSCYKLNTIQSYEYALQLLNDMKDFGVEPIRRVASYAAALALNQNAPQVALEILTTIRNKNYVAVRNLKMLALAELNRPDDCLPILRYSIEYDSPDAERRQSVYQEVLDKVQASVERLGDKEVSLEFERINTALRSSNQIYTVPLSEFLNSEIPKQPVRTEDGQGGPGGGRFGGDQRRNMERSLRFGYNDFRPKQSPAYQRDIRQSLKHE